MFQQIEVVLFTFLNGKSEHNSTMKVPRKVYKWKFHAILFMGVSSKFLTYVVFLNSFTADNLSDPSKSCT